MPLNILYELILVCLLSYTSFGLLQGSVLGAVSFNFCVGDMSHVLSKCQCLQYAGDTTIYTLFKIKSLKVKGQNLETKLNNLQTWSNETNLVFKSTKNNKWLLHQGKWQVINDKWQILMINLSTFTTDINI